MTSSPTSRPRAGLVRVLKRTTPGMFLSLVCVVMLALGHDHWLLHLSFREAFVLVACIDMPILALRLVLLWWRARAASSRAAAAAATAAGTPAARAAQTGA